MLNEQFQSTNKDLEELTKGMTLSDGITPQVLPDTQSVSNNITHTNVTNVNQTYANATGFKHSRVSAQPMSAHQETSLNGNDFIKDSDNIAKYTAGSTRLLTGQSLNIDKPKFVKKNVLTGAVSNSYQYPSVWAGQYMGLVGFQVQKENEENEKRLK
jgi:hypothetical protein